MLRTYLNLPRQVHMLCLGTLLNRVGSFVLLFLPIYLTGELKLSPTFATNCLGVFGFGSMVASIVGGQLADQIGRRFVMMLALFGGAVMLFVLSFVREPWQILMSVLAFSLLVEMYRPAASAMLADLVTPKQRPLAFGLMYTSLNLGYTFAAVIGGVVAEYSFHWLFWGDGITTGLYGFVVLLLVRETAAVTSASGGDGGSDSSVAGDSSLQKEPAQVPFREATRRILQDGTYLVFLLANLLTGIVFMQGGSTLPLHMKAEGLSNLDYGLLISINGILIVLFQLPAGHVMSRWNAMTMLIIGGTLIAVGFAINAFATTVILFGLSIVIWTAGEIVQAPFNNSVITDTAPPELRARYMGPFSMCFSAALMICAPLWGVIFEEFGPKVLWLSSGGIALIAVVLLVAIHTSVTSRCEANSQTEKKSP